MDIKFTATLMRQNEGQTLYEYLDNYFPYAENKNWAEKLAIGSIELENKCMLGNPILSENQKLSFVIKDYQEDQVNAGWFLLWQNEELFAVHKPANLPVHRTTRNIYNTLTALVRRQSAWKDAQLLHRLDLETSGIVLFAKNKASSLLWQPKFKQLLAQKKYRAIVYGNPNWSEKELTTKLSVKQDSPIRCQMFVSDLNNEGKLSTTHFKVIARAGDFSEIECELITGRKHQIRAHLAYLGHPIVGDKIYANDGEYFIKRLSDAITVEDQNNLLSDHHLLFAYQVNLNLSELSNETVTLTDHALPRQWARFIPSQ